MPDPTENLTTAQAAAALGVSTATIKKRVQSGELSPLPYSTALQRPGKFLFKREDVERLAVRKKPEEAQ